MLTTLFTAFFTTRTGEVDVYQRGIIAWLLIGLIAGWLAGKISARRRIRLHHRHRAWAGGIAAGRMDIHPRGNIWRRIYLFARRRNSWRRDPGVHRAPFRGRPLKRKPRSAEDQQRTNGDPILKFPSHPIPSPFVGPFTTL